MEKKVFRFLLNNILRDLKRSSWDKCSQLNRTRARPSGIAGTRPRCCAASRPL